VVAVAARDTANRKLEHIKIVLSADIEYKMSTLFEDIILIHNSLPEVSLDSINTEAELLGRRFSLPILIDSMTGGIQIAKRINKNLAEAAYEMNIPVSCGSQRAALEDPSLADTYRVMREVGKDLFLIGNIGVQQLLEKPVETASRVVEMIDADALAIHLNPLQEAIQPGGNVDFRGCIEAISRVVEGLNIPVIVKETGAGISREVASRLEGVGVAAINVSGAGGTSWSAVEIERLRASGMTEECEVVEVFKEWGIPTAASLIEVVRTVKIPVIASGGIRSGLDIAKAIAVGASFTGIAKPLLAPALDGKEEVVRKIRVYGEQLKIAMLLTGSSDIKQLKRARYIC
jgi:isopentenyl-diphosphate delta-isomerase